MSGMVTIFISLIAALAFSANAASAGGVTVHTTTPTVTVHPTVTTHVKTNGVQLNPSSTQASTYDKTKTTNTPPPKPPTTTTGEGKDKWIELNSAQIH